MDDIRLADERGWDSRIADVDGVDVHYVTAGPDDGEPVVLLHGFPECWWAWHRHLERLDDEFRLFALDTRGYNRSAKPVGVKHYRLAELAGDVVGVIAREGYDDAHVVGHDWGGVIGFEMGRRYPDSLRRLVVLNASYPDAFDAQLTLEQAFRSWYVGFFQLPAVPERLLSARDFAALERLFRTDPNMGAYDETDLRIYKEAWRREGALESMLNYYRAFARENAHRIRCENGDGGDRSDADEQSAGGDRSRTDAADRVRAETLVLWGERDRTLCGHIPNVIQRELESVSVVHYPDATHWLHAERPDATAAEIEAFLSA